MSNLKRFNDFAKELNTVVQNTIGDKAIKHFEKAYLLAAATVELERLLTDEYMKPIMYLQGNKLGFKTDKDREGGYDIKTVRNCLIEAVFTGVLPHGNHFNIIAGNCYITKEGFGYLLKTVDGLSYDIIPSIPKLFPEQKKAEISMNIEWEIGGVKNAKTIDFSIRLNAGMSDDAIVGKATRKARAWLYNTVTNQEITDGEIEDVGNAVVVETIKPNKEVERISIMIANAKTVDGLFALEEYVKKYPELKPKFSEKLNELDK